MANSQHIDCIVVKNPGHSLDPLCIYLRDIAPGEGELTVTCYGSAWTAWWGAMGDRNVAQFVADSDDYYLARCLHSPDRKETKREEAYRSRVARAVIDALRAHGGVK